MGGEGERERQEKRLLGGWSMAREPTMRESMSSPSSDPEIPRTHAVQRVECQDLSCAGCAHHMCFHLRDWISESARVRETVVSSFRVISRRVVSGSCRGVTLCSQPGTRVKLITQRRHAIARRPKGQYCSEVCDDELLSGEVWVSQMDRRLLSKSFWPSRTLGL